MRKPIFSEPEGFSISPLLFLLPSKGKVSTLQALTSSLYARYEKVTSQVREQDTEAGDLKQLLAEEEMLKQVLQWLEVKPGEEYGN